jgi:hypothetical protein
LGALRGAYERCEVSLLCLFRPAQAWEPARLVSFDVSPPEIAYSDDAKRLRLVKQLRTQIKGLPSVESAAVVYGLPFGTMLNATCEPRESIRWGPFVANENAWLQAMNPLRNTWSRLCALFRREQLDAKMSEEMR